MPGPAPARLPVTAREGAAAVYFPACVNRIFGNPRGSDFETTLPEALVAISARAGRPVWIPDDVAGRCCATPWSSKGYRRGHEQMARSIAESVVRWTGGGRLPLVVDASSCTHGLLSEVGGALDDETRERFAQVQVLDSIAWMHDSVLPSLTIEAPVASATVHSTCSARHLGLEAQLEAIARALAREVVVPVASTCCGTAGDRGLLHPELPAAAVRDLADELGDRPLDACLCSNRTCEIGLQQVTGRPYQSFALLAERLSRPAQRTGILSAGAC
jgi:D-lactate dehydrogenase